MSGLSEREERYLAKVGRGQRAATWIGIVLALAGGTYMAWAVFVFDYREDPRTQITFDRPVAQIAFMYDRYERLLGKIRPETSIEALLLDSMKAGMRFSSGIMVLLMRIYVGTLVLLMGLVALTVVVERRRLLRLIAKLQDG